MYKEVVEVTQGFDALFCIGKGEQGIVYKENLTSGNKVTVKELRSLHDGGIKQQKEFLNEIRTLTEIWNQNIVKLHGFCSHSQFSILIYKYLETGIGHNFEQLWRSKRIGLEQEGGYRQRCGSQSILHGPWLVTTNCSQGHIK